MSIFSMLGHLAGGAGLPHNQVRDDAVAEGSWLRVDGTFRMPRYGNSLMGRKQVFNRHPFRFTSPIL